MKVQSFTTLPRTGDADKHRVVFEQDGITVEKTIVLSGVQKRVAKSRRQEMRRLVLKAVFEAERDMAFKLFGDSWREHVGDRGCKAQINLACDMADMRPDLFPEWSVTNAHQ